MGSGCIVLSIIIMDDRAFLLNLSADIHHTKADTTRRYFSNVVGQMMMILVRRVSSSTEANRVQLYLARAPTTAGVLHCSYSDDLCAA